MIPVTAVAIFTPEELGLHGLYFAEMARMAATAYPGDHSLDCLTWDVVLAAHAGDPRHHEDAYKLASVRAAGWQVVPFHELARALGEAGERYCVRCEGVLDVAFGHGLRVWRKCPTCRDGSANIP